MFSDIDYMGGEVRWSCDTPDEDMLVVEYPNGIVLYVSFTGRFVVEIIKDSEFGVPYALSETDSAGDMYETVNRAVRLASEESARCRKNCGGLWKTRTI